MNVSPVSLMSLISTFGSFKRRRHDAEFAVLAVHFEQPKGICWPPSKMESFQFPVSPSSPAVKGTQGRGRGDGWENEAHGGIPQQGFDQINRRGGEFVPLGLLVARN